MDNFTIGGRETFVQAYAEALSEKGWAVHLLANSISHPIAGELFDSCCAMREQDCENRTQTGHEHVFVEGQRFVAALQPDVIWVQHFPILPCLYWASANATPLLLTLHGPPLGVGRYNDEFNRIGLALMVDGTSPITAVSKEIASQLHQLGLTRRRISLLKNTLASKHFAAALPAREGSVRCVMLTRQQKLGHIRAGLRAFSALRRIRPDARLTLFAGFSYGNGETRSKKDLVSLLGRKWLLRHPRVFAALEAVELRELIDDPMREITSADLVFGMGRVLLEAIAAARLPVLIGYRDPIALVSSDNIEQLGGSNFSGRGQSACGSKKLAEKIDQQLKRDRINEAGKLQEAIQLEPHVCELQAILEGLQSGEYEPVLTGGLSETVIRLSDKLARNELSPEHYVANLKSSLNAAQLSALEAQQ